MRHPQSLARISDVYRAWRSMLRWGPLPGSRHPPGNQDAVDEIAVVAAADEDPSGSAVVYEVLVEVSFSPIAIHGEFVLRVRQWGDLKGLDDEVRLHATGATGPAVFLIDMNKLFEEFIHEHLHQHLAFRLRVRGQVHTALDVAGSVRREGALPAGR